MKWYRYSVVCCWLLARTDVPKTLLLQDDGMCLPDMFLWWSWVLKELPGERGHSCLCPFGEDPLKAGEISPGAVPREPGLCPGPATYLTSLGSVSLSRRWRA